MEDIYTKNWGTDKIQIITKNLYVLRPMELHLKTDGDRNNNPSLAIVMGSPDSDTIKFVGEISLKMLNEALGELGYQIIPKS